jgi:ABC-type Zn uptake system ZnuABC Zn-binding protein ZnuA
MKSIRVHSVFIAAAAGLFVIAGCAKKETPGTEQIAVTSSYLESAVSDLTGGQAEVFCIVPPGMCPGHFDLSPEQLRQLTRSRALVRFDFQGGLDDRLKRAGVPVVVVEGLAGLSIPQTYVQTCRQVLAKLSEQGCVAAQDGEDSIARLQQRLERLTGEIRQRVADSGLVGAKVITSRHQRTFAEWLGLEVVAEIGSADAATPGQIAECLQRGRDNSVTIVIANLQEGTELAGQIARQLNGRLAVFSNFPDTSADGAGGFEGLLQSNVDNLLAAAGEAP